MSRKCYSMRMRTRYRRNVDCPSRVPTTSTTKMTRTKKVECIICWNALRIVWKPPTECSCVPPPMHKECWVSWTSQAGNPTCIICRTSVREPQHDEEPFPGPIPLPLHIILARREIAYPMVLAGILMVYLLIVTLQSSPLRYSGYPPHLHEEL